MHRETKRYCRGVPVQFVDPLLHHVLGYRPHLAVFQLLVNSTPVTNSGERSKKSEKKNRTNRELKSKGSKIML
jgi:hypothetical protein